MVFITFEILLYMVALLWFTSSTRVLCLSFDTPITTPLTTFALRKEKEGVQRDWHKGHPRPVDSAFPQMTSWT